MTVLEQYRIRAGSAAELVRGVEAGVAGGELTPGQRLPSVRALAEQLGLSPATVAAGLGALRRRGVVVSEPRRATRIAQAPPIATLRAAMPVPAGARDLSRGNPDPALLPDLRGALARLDASARLYGEAPVLAELEELAREQLRLDGLDGEQLCLVSGALDGIERILQGELRPGDRVAVENPGYAALFDLLRAQGLVLEAVALDERGMLASGLRRALARGARAVVITPRGQNPTGAALDHGRAAELREVLGEFPEVLVIEDDHLGAVAGAPLHSTLAGRARWATTRSVAKALGPDLRLAVLVGDRQTVARVQGRQSCGPGWVSQILQRLVLELWSDPVVRSGVRRATELYTERRERLIAQLRQRGIQASGRSGLNVWIAVPDEASVVGALLQRGWVLAPGAPHRLAGSLPAVRVTSAALAAEESERLADDLAAALAPSGASRSG